MCIVYSVVQYCSVPGAALDEIVFNAAAGACAKEYNTIKHMIECDMIYDRI